MADLKVSELVAATTLAAVDQLMLVQGGSSKKIDIETVLLNLPTRTKVLEATDAAPDSGVLAINKLVSVIAAKSVPTAYTLAVGTHGMEKIIVCSTAEAGSPSAVVTVTSGKGVATVTFNAVGDTVTLRNIDAFWYVVSANSVTIA